MMSNDEGDEEFFPLSAGELLTSRIGKRMTSFVRYSFTPNEQYAASGEPEDTLFSMSMDCGPLAMGFEDGIVISLATAFSSNSVVLGPDAGTDISPPLKDDPSLFPVDARDPRYSKKKFGDLIGRKLEAMSVFRPHTVEFPFTGLRNEIGLSFTFEGGGRFVFGCGLDKMMSGPSFLGFDDIEPSMLDNYIEIPIIKA